ncbi:unnamed protein product, partial [Ectocarpus sp. 8 AP-2014]
KKVRFSPTHSPTGVVYDSVSSRRLYERHGCACTHHQNFPSTCIRIHHGATPHPTTWVTSPRACAV